MFFKSSRSKRKRSRKKKLNLTKMLTLRTSLKRKKRQKRSLRSVLLAELQLVHEAPKPPPRLLVAVESARLRGHLTTSPSLRSKRLLLSLSVLFLSLRSLSLILTFPLWIWILFSRLLVILTRQTVATSALASKLFGKHNNIAKELAVLYPKKLADPQYNLNC